MDALIEQIVEVTPLGASPAAGVYSHVTNDRSREFGLMDAIYATRGGLLTGDEVLAMLRTRAPSPVSAVARPIARREVVSFTWRGQLLMPAFQFDPHAISHRAAVTRVVVEMRDVFDDWEIALWFASRNSWLGGQRPVDALDQREAAVISAARADRYIRIG